jgi:hypothetical protein
MHRGKPEEDIMNLVAHSHYKRVPNGISRHNRSGNYWAALNGNRYLHPGEEALEKFRNI